MYKTFAQNIAVLLILLRALINFKNATQTLENSHAYNFVLNAARFHSGY